MERGERRTGKEVGDVMASFMRKVVVGEKDVKDRVSRKCKTRVEREEEEDNN